MTDNNTCVMCGQRPVYIKKRGLCKQCYHHQRSGAINKGFKLPEKIPYEREILFIRNFFDHKNWRYVPAMFRLTDSTYTPDFYDGKRNVFIEVVGTKQAYYRNRAKYATFRETFPLINFEIRNITGELIEDRQGKLVNSPCLKIS